MSTDVARAHARSTADLTHDVPRGLAQYRALLLRPAIIALGQALLIGGCLYVLLGAWSRDLRVPLGFSSDSLWFLMQGKSTVDNGWWWTNPRLGAPFALDALAYPSSSNVDQAIVWSVSRFVPHAVAAVNLAWGITIVLSGLAAAWCLRALGVSALMAVTAGTLFALSPYALYRHIDHFSLVTYLVPFACAASLWLASGRPFRAWPLKVQVIVVAGCALLGFNYVYYAFFGSFCIAVGASVGFLVARDRRILASGALCIALIAGCTIVNLTPTFVSWSRHGSPMMLRDKTPAESEMFGLKIRQLVSPVFPNRVPPFQQWVQREAAARFPNENENWTARLGLIGTIGFLGLLALLFMPDGRTTMSRGASRLTLAALLLCTVGGLGSLFSLFVSADIRAYNRVFPFIEFFSLLAIALALDAWIKPRRLRLVIAVLVLAIGIGDQGQAMHSVNAKYAGIAAEVGGLETFVRTVERTLPNGAMVFQLPFRAYMNESDAGRMKRYDHFKPYLVSHTLRFSYPALSNAQVRWQEAAARRDPASLTLQLASEGFAAILVDRYGYEDNGDAMTAALLRTIGERGVIAQTDRYLALDIRGSAPATATTNAPGGDTARPAPPTELVAATLSMTPCRGQTLTIVDQIGTARAPFGADSIRLSSASELKVSGWAVDHPHKRRAGGVDVVIDRTPFPTTYGANRDDVADYFQRAEYRESGFTAAIAAAALPKGEHALALRVVASDGGCYYQSRGQSVVIE